MCVYCAVKPKLAQDGFRESKFGGTRAHNMGELLNDTSIDATVATGQQK